jgi:hypothetical protein
MKHVVLDHGIATEGMQTTMGVPAGSPHATYETNAYVLHSVLRYINFCPDVPMSIHVDDVHAAAEGPDYDSA